LLVIIELPLISPRNLPSDASDEIELLYFAVIYPTPDDERFGGSIRIFPLHIPPK
jgi:hypothetical protein